jgi:hypothetical protein
VLAAHLNELGLGGSSAGSSSSGAPSHPPYPVAPSRSNGNKAALPAPASQFAAATAAREAAREAARGAAREAVAAQHSDSDNEEEPAVRGTRNDGTLLASDPPKPLSVYFNFLLIIICFCI